MIIQTKEIYKCEYCRKIYQIKRFAESHEKMCKKNPENNRACFGCNFLQKKEVEVKLALKCIKMKALNLIFGFGANF